MAGSIPILISITANIDARYVQAIESTVRQQADHLCNLIAEAMFGEDQATLLMGPIKVLVSEQDTEIILGETERHGSFETRQELDARFRKA